MISAIQSTAGRQKKNPMYYYLRKDWKVNAVTMLLIIFEKARGVYWNVTMMTMLQAIIDKNVKIFAFWIGIEGLLALFGNALEYVQNRYKRTAISQMNGGLRRDMGYSLLRKSHQEFHSKQTGEYLSQFTDDVNQIEQLAWEPFYNLVGEVASIVLSLVVLVSLHWSLLVVSLVTAAAMILAPKLVQRKIERLSQECTQAQALAVSKLKDLLSGFDVLRFFSRERRFLEGIEDANSQTEGARKERSVKQMLWNDILDTFAFAMQEANVVLIGVLSIQGILPISTIFGGGNLCSSVYNGFRRLSNLRLSMISAKPYFDKITVHADENTDLSAEKPMQPISRGIEMEGLSFAYESKPVLKNASFTFEKGKKYALTGSSGCGKSTVLKLLLGWLPGYSGKILLDGRDAREYTPEQLQSSMSYIEQDVFLFNSTIRDNITLGESFTDEQMDKALKESALAGDLVNMPQGLDTLVGEDGSCLSGGQKQRVAIARALIHGRSILLVDEGTSALDQKNADIVEKSLLSNPDLTLILVSHHLSNERKAQFDKVYTLEPVLQTAG